MALMGEESERVGRERSEVAGNKCEGRNARRRDEGM
jgi:hypothetical protein